MPQSYICFSRALRETLAHIHPGETVRLPARACEGHVTSEKLYSLVDSPSTHTSLKDGYALRAADGKLVSGAGPQPLPVTGSVAAGQMESGRLQPGTAWRILTGARLPEGAETVVAEEFVTRTGDLLTLNKVTAKGRNILARGSDVARGELLLDAGRHLTPGRIGLLVAGGHHQVTVYRKPAVALMATGDEVLLPGEPPVNGKLYASNLLTLNGWCRHFGFTTTLGVSGDKASLLREKIQRAMATHDALVTSGGAWTGDKDLMAKVLDDLGWQKVYHRVRLGPGKAVGFGLLNGKPVFILPGGPPSNLVAFLELALPGLQKLGGCRTPGLAEVPAVLKEPVSGQSDWTQVLFGTLKHGGQILAFQPDGRPASRLKSMADAEALLLIPEGVDAFSANQKVTIQTLGGFPL
jgi:molybdopterin molybdotransferase